MNKNKHNTIVGSEIERTDERIDQTGEVFTPIELCIEMVNEIPLDVIQNPQSKFLDNSAGNGNFVIALLNKLTEYHSREHVLNHMLYAVELMEDNHKEMCERLGVDITHSHYVCHDALTYDYSFGEPMGVEEFFSD
jgi:type I restriction-modification system DNA methylase subunit